MTVFYAIQMLRTIALRYRDFESQPPPVPISIPLTKFPTRTFLATRPLWLSPASIWLYCGQYQWSLSVRVVFDTSGAIARHGDNETADEIGPVEAVDLSELRGRITSRDVLDSLADGLLPQAQFLHNLDDLDCKSIVPSLMDSRSQATPKRWPPPDWLPATTLLLPVLVATLATRRTPSCCP